MRYWLRRLLDLMAAAIPILLIATTVSAQDHTGLVAATKATLQARGVNLLGACGAAQITVRVAYALRDQGYGLLVKRAGNRAVFLPDGTCLDGDQTSAPGFATDYLIFGGTGYGYDLLQDGGGMNGPQWLGPETDAEMVARNRSNFALAPSLDTAAPAPPPPPVYIPPPPVPAPAPPTIPSVDYTGVLQQLLANQQLSLAFQQEALTIAKDTNERVKSMDRTLTQTLGSVSKFVGKYIAPALAGYLTARELQKE